MCYYCHLQTWEAGLQSLAYVDTCSIWLNKVTVAVVASQVSRHNTPSSAHKLSKYTANLAQHMGKELVVVSYDYCYFLF